MTTEVYPGLLDRIKALIADSIVIVILIFIISSVFSWFEHVPDIARIIAFVFVFLLYDPIFTSVFGGTIGHMIVGIRVKKDTDEQKNISFPLALLRYVVKAFLGGISLLTVSGNQQGKAIHDFVADSVVIYAKPREQI
jgi:uncharacterized RDD family membrane protein YckC